VKIQALKQVLPAISHEGIFLFVDGTVVATRIRGVWSTWGAYNYPGRDFKLMQGYLEAVPEEETEALYAEAKLHLGDALTNYQPSIPRST
jgi:hypothetical protein